MSDIDLIVTDLDGTLWYANERIHERTLDALRNLERQGTPLLVATGRRPRSAAAGLARESLTPPAVFLDGAVGYDLGSGRRFHRASFPAGTAHTVLAAFERCGLSPCLYVDREDADVVVGPAPSTRPEHLAHIGPWLAYDDPWAVVEREEVLAIGVVGCDEQELRSVHAAVGDAAASAVVRDLMFGGATLIARPPGVSKWEGVEAFCCEQGLDPERVLALGDGENDVELLTAAAVACVVSDGCDAALALADHVIEPASAGGWGAVLDLV
ncbi:MAG: HAD-IIB family hydrolase [Nitriliruptorales bacterium]|nr:HAD-IIB family hydrolase [Nitriliruptorales bacterium]